MLIGLLLTMTVVCNAAILRHSNRPRGCVTHVRLRDKWRFLHEGRTPFIRIRRNVLIFRHRKVRVRFKCVENFENIYLFRKSNFRRGVDAAVCVGFSYVADRNFAEYTLTRLMGPGIANHVMSPKLFPHGYPISVNSTCDFQGPKERRPYAFLQRAVPGCKFPRNLQRSWNFTYLRSRSLDIAPRDVILVLLDGRRLVFSCEARDSNRYVIRLQGFPADEQDSFMCVRFKRMSKDSFYKYEFSRLNSGNLMDGLLRVVKKGQPVRMHQHCDWLDSPARPEFMYP